MEMMVTIKHEKLTSIQSLRGLAALLVLLSHATVMFDTFYNYQFLNGVFYSGVHGVDIFFVLSGFIIYYIHHKDIGHVEKFKTYARKRFVRIYPVYLVVTLLLMPLYFAFPSLGIGYERDWDVVVTSLLLLPHSNHPPILSVGWTLCFEMLFYALFSLLLVLKRKIALSLLVAWVVLTILNFVTLPEGSLAFPFRFMFDPITIEFVFGCAIAYLYLNHKSINAKLVFFIGITVFVLFAIIELNTSIHIHRAISYGVASALIIYGAVLMEREKQIKIPRALGYLGDASFSIYLVHYHSLSAINKLFKVLNVFSLLGNFLAVFLSVIIAVFIGCSFYEVVEKPLMKRLNKHVFINRKSRLQTKNINESAY